MIKNGIHFKISVQKNIHILFGYFPVISNAMAKATLTNGLPTREENTQIRNDVTTSVSISGLL